MTWLLPSWRNCRRSFSTPRVLPVERRSRLAGASLTYLDFGPQARHQPPAADIEVAQHLQPPGVGRSRENRRVIGNLATLRREPIDSYISSAPERVQLRLRQLQFRIDGIRITSRSLLAVSRKIHALMQEFLFQLKDKLQQFGDLSPGDSLSLASPPDRRDGPLRSARVIPLAHRSADSRHTGCP